MAKSDKVQKLYFQYELLSGRVLNSIEEEKAYLEILSAAKGLNEEKKLASQFIPTFFERFPDLCDIAFNIYIDLCEDKDSNVRKEAIKKFPRFYSGQPNIYTKKFADILTQLLLVKDSTEVSLVSSSLTTILKSDPLGSLKGIFNQIKYGENAVREAAIKFLANKIRKVNSDWNANVQDFLISEIKNILPESSPEEISLFFGMLLSTRLGKPAGRKQILQIFLSCVESNKEDLLINDSQSLRKLISFLRNARVLFCKEINSNKYFLLFCNEIIPRYLSFTGSREGSGCCLWLLKLFAEITTYTKDLSNIDTSIQNVVDLLVEFLPCPSLGDSPNSYKRLQFSTVECLLSVLHTTLKFSPSFFSERPQILTGLRYRLLYFARASKAYSKVIEDTLNEKTKEVGRIKTLAIRTLFNINVLIKDFFQNPPSQSVNIILSWMFSDNSSSKRSSPDECKKTEKIQKTTPIDLEDRHSAYKPPIGKYSHNLVKFSHNEKHFKSSC